MVLMLTAQEPSRWIRGLSMGTPFSLPSHRPPKLVERETKAGLAELQERSSAPLFGERRHLLFPLMRERGKLIDKLGIHAAQVFRFAGILR